MTDSRTVQVTVWARTPPGTPASSRATKAVSPNAMEASPRGPNHPMKTMGSVRRWAPASAIATGTMRTTVRLRAHRRPPR